MIDEICYESTMIDENHKYVVNEMRLNEDHGYYA